jgi:multimeric flavodoxin WrbA
MRLDLTDIRWRNNRMQRVLGIMGSPRKNGNTHILVDKILEGAKDVGAATEMLLLCDMAIRECDGCLACWKGRDCSKADDMNAVYPRLAASDVLVFGTPVYWYGPTALMKAFLDRFVYFNCPENRPKVKGKSAIVAVPFEEDNIETAASVLAMLRKSLAYLEMTLAGEVVVPGVGRKGDVLVKKEALQRAYEMGRQCAMR